MAIEITKETAADATTGEYWPPPQGQWTYEDYSRLPDNGLRYEVIKGELIMTPAPVPVHQKIIATLYRHLWEYVQKQSAGELFFAPIDVNLPDLASTVQPDLLFIAAERLDIIKEKFIEGPPDLIMEILSAGSERQDRRVKFELYARAGVREYWLVDPDERTIDIFVLRGQAYAPLDHFTADAQTRSELLPGFTVKVGEVCPA